MKIREIRALGLYGATPEGGWSNELQPDDCVHTLIVVLTDEGVAGLGSVYTSEALVRGALAVLQPLYVGENALEPERVSEKLHQHTFWQGRGGAITHAISGIDIALWDILARSPTRSAGSTSRCGIFWARRPASRSGGCWAGVIASACGPTRRY
jgi:D-galactarolactone cycloisomerase